MESLTGGQAEPQGTPDVATWHASAADGSYVYTCCRTRDLLLLIKRFCVHSIGPEVTFVMCMLILGRLP